MSNREADYFLMAVLLRQVKKNLFWTLKEKIPTAIKLGGGGLMAFFYIFPYRERKEDKSVVNAWIALLTRWSTENDIVFGNRSSLNRVVYRSQ